jgi:hypothetical protein
MVLANPGFAKSRKSPADTAANSILGRQNFPTSPSAISSRGRSPSGTHPPLSSGMQAMSLNRMRLGAGGAWPRSR